MCAVIFRWGGGCAWYVNTCTNIKMETFATNKFRLYISGEYEITFVRRYLKSADFQGAKIHRQPFCCVLYALKGISYRRKQTRKFHPQLPKFVNVT